MKMTVLVLCFASLMLPAQARRRFATSISRPATVQAGFSPTTPYMTGSNVPNVTLNSGYGVHRGRGRGGRRGYRGYYYSSGYSNGAGPASNGIPGYNTSLPQKPLPGY